MALFGFNSRRYEMLMSAVLLLYATWRTANCVALAILIGTYQLANDIPARRGNACVRSYTHLQAFIHETVANSELQRYTAELQDRTPLTWSLVVPH